jgi:hypothetical protein
MMMMMMMMMMVQYFAERAGLGVSRNGITVTASAGDRVG